MVKFALPLAALAMAASVAAAPAPATTSANTFSFEAWVEDIIANPDTALSVEEALAAAEHAEVVGAAGLRRRAVCDIAGWKRANGRDAAYCVDYLARLGQGGTSCDIGSGLSSIQMCRWNNAEIVGSKMASAGVFVGVNCNDVARSAGMVFDSCWRSDDTLVGSQECVNQPRMNILVRGV